MCDEYKSIHTPPPPIERSNSLDSLDKNVNKNI